MYMRQSILICASTCHPRTSYNPAAREDMCLCSYYGGLSLANAKLGAVHGFSGTLGGLLHAPHGEGIHQ